MGSITELMDENRKDELSSSHSDDLISTPAATMLHGHSGELEIPRQEGNKYHFEPKNLQSTTLRAWDRVPRKSNAPQHVGRTVWKRYNLRTASSKEEEENTMGGNKSTLSRRGTPHPIKRMRIQDPFARMNLGHDSNENNSLTTAVEQMTGTPRRKATYRSSPIKTRRISQSSLTPRPTKPRKSLPGRRRQTLSTFALAPAATLVTPPRITHQVEVQIGTERRFRVIKAVETKRLATPDKILGGKHPAQESVTELLQEDISPTQPKSSYEEEPLVLSATTLQDQDFSGLLGSQENETLPDSISTTIVTTPALDPDFASKATEKDVMVDEMQERRTDIATSANHCGNGDEVELQLVVNNPTPYLNHSLDDTENIPADELQGTSTSAVVSNSDESIDQENISSGSFNRGSESTLQNDSYSETANGLQDAGEDDDMADELSGIADAVSSHGLPADEVNDVLKTDQSSPTRVRRSNRFSDDASILKDFLSRAQARRAASKICSETIRSPMKSSPRRTSPRKALETLDANTSSPSKALNGVVGIFTREDSVDEIAQAMESKVETATAEVGMDGDQLQSSRRSSRRKVLDTPAKSESATKPNRVAIRRIDGTGNVILVKSEAQELATATRANTRRNRGQSKMPKLMLPILITDDHANAPLPSKPTAKVMRKHDGKIVSWDETLVYFQRVAPTSGKKVEKEEEEEKEAKREGSQDGKRPKSRRLKGLGATNGTPAPKKFASPRIPVPMMERVKMTKEM
ncbi:hypothetical protein MMC25_005866 [Agyrium rufum]|nr:hypothetical protein [Agyrium rufum]